MLTNGKSKLEIRDLTGPYLGKTFLETLSNLAETEIAPDKRGEIFRHRLSNNVRTYIAVEDGEVVGTISLLLMREFIHNGALSGRIADVAVRKGWERKGIGTVLIKHATEQARNMGCYKVTLSCYEDLVKLYEKAGYRKHDCGMRIDLEKQ